MLKGRSRDPRAPLPVTSPHHPAARAVSQLRPLSQAQRAPLAKPEPDYEVVEFPEQYVNAKLQPPPPPPPRPPTGHPADAGASCGLCGGGGARVRCTECGRRALCASCDDMYHRHPKRRHHQRQALSPTQLRDERPPLPPKTTAPVPPPRRHKLSGDRSSASPRPPGLDQRRATIDHLSTMPNLSSHGQTQSMSVNRINTANNLVASHHMAAHSQRPAQGAARLGSMPYLTNVHHPAAPVAQPQVQSNTLAHLAPAWNRQRGSLQGFNMQPNMAPTESWESPESISPPGHSSSWGRPMRRGASVVDLGGGGGGAGCAGCAHAVPAPPQWRYGSCASLENQWAGAWPPPPACCAPHPAHHNLHMYPHPHMHPPQTPQPYRRVESRAVSRANSRTGSRAASPAMSVRSRASRRHKHRTPSPPPLPSSDADSESESDDPPSPAVPAAPTAPTAPRDREEDSLGPAPPPPAATWQCEHCTFVNEPGVRVCVVCCRTPTAAPKIVAEVNNNMAKLKYADERSPSPAHEQLPVREEPRSKLNGESAKPRTTKERTSTGCGPSPPREGPQRTINRLVTPTKEQINSNHAAQTRARHDMGVGPSPPREMKERHSMSTGTSPPRASNESTRASPYREQKSAPERHSVSVGPSPPRDNTLKPSSTVNVQKKFAGTSPPREAAAESRPARANVTTTGTSPPPQSISTQTYEVAPSWERASSAPRSRPRRRLRDEPRERSHSRHSLSSDTRESERSARTSGGAGGRWEWRERDSSPGAAADWSGSEPRAARLAPRLAPRLERRASHLDLRRARPPSRAPYYGSEAASPEPAATRTLSLEALAGVGAGSRREAERGLELARLLAEAERLGFSAAEVQAALAQQPAAPLAWLRERWPGLCAGVRAAAARLAPGAAVSERDARAALARHRGAMWPAVSECVERHRRQAEAVSVGEEGRLRGLVWGSAAGADDDAAPPGPGPRRDHRARAEDSSDEFEAPTPIGYDDDWMYLPLDPPAAAALDPDMGLWSEPPPPAVPTTLSSGKTEDIASRLKSFLIQAGVPSIDENLLLQGLLADGAKFNSVKDESVSKDSPGGKRHSVDLVQSENDFIDAYNALTRASPLPNINDPVRPETLIENILPNSLREVNRIPLHNNRLSIDDKNKKVIKRDVDIEIELIRSQPAIEYSSPSPAAEKVLVKDMVQDTPSTVLDKNPALSNSNKQMQMSKLQVNPSENNIVTKNLTELQAVTTKNVSPEPPAQTSIASSNDIKPNKSQQFDSSRPEEEKTSNLSDIVDNTQRLIQQMKEEINSDINSLDGRSMSQSEADNSSNESDLSTEHQSSYSGTEDETEDMTSDDNGTFSIDEGNNIRSAKSETGLNRTSSEDNDQFEEAMDHIEEQNENFKQANIEILDSIARSLQEEHTISVEINQSLDSTVLQELTESGLVKQEQQQNVAKKRRQDFNNNSFTEVRSFEEIYEQLNSSVKIENNNSEVNGTFNPEQHLKENLIGNIALKQVQPIANRFEQELNNTQNTSEILTKEPEPTYIAKVVVDKHQINVTEYHPEAPIKVIVSDNAKQIFNAVMETIEDNLESVVENYLEGNTNNSYENEASNEPNASNNNVNTVLDEIRRSAEEIQLSENDYTDSDSSRDTISPMKGNVIQNPQKASNSESTSIHISPIIKSLIINQNSERNTRLPTTEKIMENHIVENIAITDHHDTNIITPNNSNMNINLENGERHLQPVDNKGKSKSPEISPTRDTANIKNTATTKSNIPKLVKVLPNSKQKIDKAPAKVIASKVPVRRSSLKQHPAPSPPKTHFGNIQSGHVKQLQTRLFNDKSQKATANAQMIEDPIEVKPSTSSTLNKKRLAPLPPSNAQDKQNSPPKTLPEEEKKKNYFRETCRTEDEWTESDSEDSQFQIRKPSEDEPPRAVSPPPPITVRRVSGQLIDLARVRLLEGSPERQARMLLAEGATENWEQAQLAVELVSRGAEPPAALLAALECADLNAALAYLHQDCELCASRLPEHEMLSMLRCTHRCCRECARLYFAVQVTERSVADCVCPFCKEPELESLPEDEWLDYFAQLDILLKGLLEADLHELFQRKLRDRTLARDPNFRWCVECSSGFFVHPKQKKLRCPECKSVSCASCRKPWSANHEGLSCEQYSAWLDDNDPERSAAAVQQHLRENGLECPRCHFKYSLSRGGCMHFTCTQCKYEFCYGCGKPFMMGARCGLSEYCARLGLHAHHPRNCLFYLRDKEPHELQTLLQMNNISYESEGAEGNAARCPVQLQRETPAGLVDGACGGDVQRGHAGLCKAHYVEYLAGLARGPPPLDPIPIMEVAELVAELRRRALPLPERGPWDTDPVYAGMCAEIVKEKIPLD